MEVIGEREEYSKYKKRQADDGDRKKIASSVLPETANGFFQEVF